MIEAVERYIADQQRQAIERLDAFLRFPSVSTDPELSGQTRVTGEWVRDQLAACGLEAELVETAGHPCVIADSGPADGGGATLLIYGHYDVQPAGDESLWKSEPFEPTTRDGSLFARGAADDKGQVLAHMLAVEAWLKVAKRLPIRVKFLIEGEEEIGSPNLGELVRQHRDRLACDYVVLSDTAKLDATTPAITYSTKGLVYKEIVVTGPKSDLHSGSFGGTVANPANVLAGILAGLKDGDERITIPGFYDDVRILDAGEVKMLEALPLDDADYLTMTGSPGFDGEAGYSTKIRRWARPTLDVNGLCSGFIGEGSSTIIPSKAMAKVSMRIVPDQDPEKISAAFDQAIKAAAPASVRVEVSSHASAAAYVCPLDCPGINAAVSAVEAGFRKKPVLIREGGTLPILPLFKEVLGAESIMIGFALPDSNAHGPNEFIVLDDFHAGIRTAAHFMQRLA